MSQVVLCDIPLFDRSVVAVIGCPEIEAVSLFTRYLTEKEQNAPELDILHGPLGWCQQRGGDFYIWVKDIDKPSVLLHEVVHAAFGLCRITDVAEGEELIARLVEHMKLNLMDKLLYPEEVAV